MKGQHYYLDDNQSTAIRKALEIRGIPFYLLIDKNGNIIEKGSHIRPGLTKTHKKIQALLTEEVHSEN